MTGVQTCALPTCTLDPDLVDLARNKLGKALPGRQSLLLSAVIQDAQQLNWGQKLHVILDGSAKVALPKLGEVLKPADVNLTHAVAVDGDTSEDLLAWHIHDLFKPSHLKRDKTLIAGREVLADLQHGQQWDLTVEVSPSAAMVQVKLSDKAIRLNCEYPQQISDFVEDILVRLVYDPSHVSTSGVCGGILLFRGF